MHSSRDIWTRETGTHLTTATICNICGLHFLIPSSSFSVTHCSLTARSLYPVHGQVRESVRLRPADLRICWLIIHIALWTQELHWKKMQSTPTMHCRGFLQLLVGNQVFGDISLVAWGREARTVVGKFSTRIQRWRLKSCKWGIKSNWSPCSINFVSFTKWYTYSKKFDQTLEFRTDTSANTDRQYTRHLECIHQTLVCYVSVCFRVHLC